MTYNTCICHIIMFSRLPHEIIDNHIMPYAYNLQPKELLLDIRTFVSDFSLISSVYHTQYNDLVLLNDLESLVDYIDENTITNSLQSSIVLSRLCENRNQITSKISFLKQKNVNTARKTRLLWGLFTPRERTLFFNRFIIEDLDE